MQTYNRLVIDILKDIFTKAYANIEINEGKIAEAILTLQKELDKRIIRKEDTSEIDQLIKDLQFIKYEILTGEHN